VFFARADHHSPVKPQSSFDLSQPKWLGEWMKKKTKTKKENNMNQNKPFPHHCPSGCHKCCQPVQCTYAEAEAMGIPGQSWTGARPDGKCALLDDEKGCTVYENRPALCRMFGSAKEGMFCCKFSLSLDGLLSGDDTIAPFEATFEEGFKDGSCADYVSHPERLRLIQRKDIEEGFAPSPLAGVIDLLEAVKEDA
jgi:Fe-S-cluster containining protein